jgi:uroporphyrinogen-III decarboxylase
MTFQSDKLISYIAPAAPATRRPATGKEAFMRPEIGFTPKWYHQALGINFGKQWHTDPAFRRETVLAMRNELKKRFPNSRIGRIDEPDQPLDLLTGTYGACTVAAIYNVPIIYAEDNWPTCAQKYLSDEEVDQLIPPDLESNTHFRTLMSQIDWIAEKEGRIEGYINWQGVLNNAQRLRGQEIFMDMIMNPDRVRHLFDCVTTTMIDGAKYLMERQKKTGVEVKFITISNCLVNMVSAEHYEQLLLPYDQRIASAFEYIGVHNCAWNANPYLTSYAKIPNVKYLDMGYDSDLMLARKLFPDTRRAIMYTPMDVANKSVDEIRADLEHIANEYGPCDIVAADIEANTPDERVMDLIRICVEISNRKENI